jgi:hypothetical protein
MVQLSYLKALVVFKERSPNVFIFVCFDRTGRIDQPPAGFDRSSRIEK